MSMLFAQILKLFFRGVYMYEVYCKLRDLRGVKDADVVRATGITKSTFYDWKSGRSEPKKEKLQKIADFFDVSLDYLMTGEEQNGYYLNEETAKLAQEMFEDEDMRSLFNMKRNMPPERFKAHIEFMKNLYEQEKGNDM